MSGRRKAPRAAKAGRHQPSNTSIAVANGQLGSLATGRRRLSGGQGVHVVYDSVGKSTFEGSLDCLRPRGMLVLFGQSSGVVPPIDPAMLVSRGSLFLTRPTMLHYLATREELVQSAERLFDVVGRGAVRVSIGQSYPLRDAARAHADLEGRRTTGSTVLLP